MMMKRSKIFTPLLFLFMVIAPAIKSQTDTLFWFAAPWVTTDPATNIPIALQLETYSNASTIRIQQPASSYDTTINLAANSTFQKDLSHIINSVEGAPANSIINNGLKITSDFPISAIYQVITTASNPESFSLKGQNGMGYEFITPFQTKWNANATFNPAPRSMFCIVATQNNTSVSITPRAAIVGHSAGVTFSIVLQAGQSYTCENLSGLTSQINNNLSGSVIVSNKPVCVTVSDDSVEDDVCSDLIGDQIVPVDVLGKEYVVNKGSMTAQANEGVFIVATKNFTTITFNDGASTSTAIINKGETYYYEITQPILYVSADKEIYVLQTTGIGCELGEAIVPPINCSGSSNVNFTRNNNDTFILNVVCKSGDESSFLVNGNSTLLQASTFTVVPGTGGQLMSAQKSFSTIEMPAGIQNSIVNSNGSFFSVGIISGDASYGATYHYASSFIRKVYVDAGADQNVCSGLGEVSLNGTVSGAASTGLWSIINGTGSLNYGSGSYVGYAPTTNDTIQGFVLIKLESTGNCSSVSDTIKINFNPSPIVNAGNDIFLCRNNADSIVLNGTIRNVLSTNWSGGNGGMFSSNITENTVYYPSSTELLSDSITLAFSSTGSSFGCSNVTDSIRIYIYSAPVVNAGSGATVCSNNAVVNLSGSVSGITTTGIWTTDGSGYLTPNDTILNGLSYIPSNTDTVQGVVYIKLSSTNNLNCKVVSDSIAIVIVKAPNVQILNSNDICADQDSIILSASVTSGFSIEWTTNGVGSFDNSSIEGATYYIAPADSAQGLIQLILSTLPGVCSSVTDTLFLNLAKPINVFAGNDAALCENEKLNLDGLITGSVTEGIWSTSGSGSFSSLTQLFATYTPSVGDLAGSVNIILTSNTSAAPVCPADADTLVLTFKKVPTAQFAANSVCLGQTTTFVDFTSAPNGETITGYSWDFGDSQVSIADLPTHTYTASGVFAVTQIVTASNACKDTIQDSVRVNLLPNPSFSVGVICQGSEISFKDLSTISNGSISTWVYSFGDGTSNSNDANPNHIYNSNGVFSVNLTVTSDKNCSKSISQNVSVLPQPDAAFSASSLIVLAGENINFTDESLGGVTSWSWNFGDTSGTNTQNTSHIYVTGGLYTMSFTVKDANGCIDTLSKEILVAMMPALPTAFTPNADNVNDKFYVRGGPFKKLYFYVYNSWGELVFKTDDINEGWDGQYKGVDQPIGAYVWQVEVELSDGRILKKSGDVTLIR